MKPVQPVGFPSRWAAAPLWTLYRRVARRGYESEDLLSVYRDHGVVPRGFTDDNWNRIPDDLTAYQLVKPGDLVLNKMKAWQGSLGVSQLRGIVSPAYFVFSPVRGNHDRRFLHHLLRSRPYVDSYGRMSGGIRVDQWDLDPWAFSRLVVPLPQPAEQRAIADFLDRETAKIDALIEKQNHLIDLLLERRSGALAAFLDVDGVASPGPRLKHHIASVRQGWSPQCNDWPAKDGGWAVLRAGCINGGRFRPGDNKELPADLEPRKETVVRVGDLVVSRANTRELVGGAAVVHEPHPRLMLSDKLYAFSLRNSANPDFVALVLRTRRYRDLIELEATGASQSMQNITQEVLRNLPFSLPDRQTQDQLVIEAAARMKETDELIAKAEEFIALARERRAALITAAVTGRLDVTREAS